MYQRNQVEWAIWQALDRGRLSSDEIPISVHNTLRRLIDVDRKLWVNTRASQEWEHRFAFIEGIPQGRGGENHYRLEETLMLWLALQCFALGLSQTDTIQFLRTLKPSIDKRANGIRTDLQARITVAVREGGLDAEALKTRRLLPENELMYVVSSSASDQVASAHRSASKISQICSAGELLDILKTYTRSDGRFLVLEFANAAASLAYFLEISPRMKRGRAASM